MLVIRLVLKTPPSHRILGNKVPIRRSSVVNWTTETSVNDKASPLEDFLA